MPSDEIAVLTIMVNLAIAMERLFRVSERAKAMSIALETAIEIQKSPLRKEDFDVQKRSRY